MARDPLEIVHVKIDQTGGDDLPGHVQGLLRAVWRQDASDSGDLAATHGHVRTTENLVVRIDDPAASQHQVVSHDTRRHLPALTRLVSLHAVAP